MEAAVTTYQTRARKAQCLPKSRIDRRRTKMTSRQLDTDEDENTSDDEEESDGDESVQSSDSNDDREQVQNPVAAAQSSDEENVNPSKRRRTLSTNVFSDSDSSSGSEIWNKPVRKIKGNSRRIFVQDGGEDSGEEGTSATNLSVGTEDSSQREKRISIARKRKRHLEMKRLAKKTRPHHLNSGIGHFSEESDEERGAPSPYEVGSSDSDFEKDSLKDFIVEDDDEEEEESGAETQFGENHTSTPKHPQSSKSILAKHLPNLYNNSPYNHFKRVVKGLLINALDVNFLKSLYEGTRTKKYAKEILSSLNYMDDRCIKPRLVNLKTTSRWSNRYQERIDCYPTLQVKQHAGIQRSCQACELNRTCRFTVILSGLLYNGKSLEEDNFMSNDEQTMKVGNVCMGRTEIYHNLKHFKYSLYQKCCETVQSDTQPDEQVKDTIDRLYKYLDEHQWIEEEYKHFQYFLDGADNFHKEKNLFE